MTYNDRVAACADKLLVFNPTGLSADELFSSFDSLLREHFPDDSDKDVLIKRLNNRQELIDYKDAQIARLRKMLKRLEPGNHPCRICSGVGHHTPVCELAKEITLGGGKKHE